MNAEQLDHLQKVLRHFREIEMRHYLELGEPAGHICESLTQLQWYLTQEKRKRAGAGGDFYAADNSGLAELAA